MRRPENDSPASPSRRRLLGTSAAVGAGAVAGAAGGWGLLRSTADERPAAAPALHGSDRISFHGEHQAGVETPAQAHARFTALDLADATDGAAIGRLLRLLTDDIGRLASGRGPLTDAEPELAAAPSRLTVTIGVGSRVLQRLSAAVPGWLAPLPAFPIDRLRPEHSGGDLLLHLGSDDPVALAHAHRQLLGTTRSFAAPRWSLPGFRTARGAQPDGRTQRNLFGQVDGTVNPRPGTPDFTEVVWDSPEWLPGGTSLVIRRIAMDMDGWAELDRPGRELAMGRTLPTGAPLTGTREHDQPDYAKKGPHGFAMIPEFSHVRRASGADEGAHERILRRPYNYVVPDATGAADETGLIFASYQKDPRTQFVPIQKRLAELDLMNQWTTPVGSSVFAILPGCRKGEVLGQALLD